MLTYIEEAFYYCTDKMKKILFVILLGVLSLEAMAQDARIAHPFLWKSYYNPAYCASERMLKIDLGAQSTYSHKPSLFLDSHFSVEVPLSSENVAWGLGAKVSNQYQGSGLLNITSISPMVSVGMILYDRNPIHSILQVGIEFNSYSTKTNYDKMVFGDQLDPYYGLYKDFSEELSYFADDNFWVFDMAVGIYGQTQFSRYKRFPIVLKYGFSVFHLTSDKERSFYSKEESTIYMPSFYNRRFCANVEYLHPIEIGRDRVVLGGYGLYEFQGGMHDIQLGINTSYKWFVLGLGAKVEQYEYPIADVSTGNPIKYDLTNLIFSATFSPQFKDKRYSLKLAYSFEFPVTQGFVSETSIHCLSLHFRYDYSSGYGTSGNSKFSCKKYNRPSDEAWYLFSNTY